MWPGMPSHSKVQTIRLWGTISRYSPRKPCSSTPSGPRWTQRYFPPGRKSISQISSEYFRGPHHLSRCSHLLCASKTSSRGASNSRVITISRSDGRVIVSAPTFLFSAMVVLLPGYSIELQAPARRTGRLRRGEPEHGLRLELVEVPGWRSRTRCAVFMVEGAVAHGRRPAARCENLGETA